MSTNIRPIKTHLNIYRVIINYCKHNRESTTVEVFEIIKYKISIFYLLFQTVYCNKFFIKNSFIMELFYLENFLSSDNN
jgi:hypothetical protein